MLPGYASLEGGEIVQATPCHRWFLDTRVILWFFIAFARRNTAASATVFGLTLGGDVAFLV